MSAIPPPSFTAPKGPPRPAGGAGLARENGSVEDQGNVVAEGILHCAQVRGAGDWPDWLVLPGYAEARASCGSFLGSAIVCAVPGDGHRREVKLKRCRRPACETCYPSWAWRQGRRAQERIESYAALSGKALAPRHVVFSPPQDWARELVRSGRRGIEKLRGAAARMAQDAGMTAFCMIFHPWRTRAKGKGRYRAGRNYLAPHFHLIGYGRIEKADDFHARTGWTYHVIGAGKKQRAGAMADREDVAGTVAYALDHAGLDADRPLSQSIRWYGELGNNKLQVEREWTEEREATCHCGSTCHQHLVDPVGNVDPRPGPIAMEKVRRRRFKWRPPRKAHTVTRLTTRGLPDDEEGPPP